MSISSAHIAHLPLPAARIKSTAVNEQVPLLGEEIPLQQDPARLFLYPALEQRLATLLHMVEKNRAITIVMGDYGSGKSSLARYCEQHSWQQRAVVHLQARENFSVSQFWQDLSLLMEAGLDLAQPAQDLAHTLLSSREQFNHVLVIDDAHCLDVDCLEALLHLKHIAVEKKIRFAIALFCEQDIKRTLINDTLLGYTDGGANFIYMPRLNEQDTRLYIEHHLLACGVRDYRPRPRELHLFYKSSGGLPRRINEMLDRILLDRKHSRQRFWLLLQHRPRTIFIAVALLSLASISGYFLSSEPETTAATLPASTAIADHAATVAPTRTQWQITDITVPETRSSEAANPPLPDPVPITARTTSAIEPGDEIVGADDDIAADAATAPHAASIGAYYTEQWLLAQPARNYTIQLSGTRTLAHLQTFVREHADLGEKPAIAHIKLNGADWFVLLYGDYGNIREAKRALGTLPEAVRRNHPWIRKIGPLQTTLAENP